MNSSPNFIGIIISRRMRWENIYMGRCKMYIEFESGNLKGPVIPRVDGRIILKRVLKYFIKVWTGFN
jgi:hypothetical protein